MGNVKTLDKIRKFGGHMSGMVMPNLGAFVGWGLLAALFIPTGWMPNEKLNEMKDYQAQDVAYSYGMRR